MDIMKCERCGKPVATNAAELVWCDACRTARGAELEEEMRKNPLTPEQEAEVQKDMAEDEHYELALLAYKRTVSEHGFEATLLAELESLGRRFKGIEEMTKRADMLFEMLEPLIGAAIERGLAEFERMRKEGK